MAVLFKSISPTAAASVPIYLLDVMDFDPASALTSRLRCSRSIPAITSGGGRRKDLICRRKPAGQCFPISPNGDGESIGLNGEGHMRQSSEAPEVIQALTKADELRKAGGTGEDRKGSERLRAAAVQVA